MKTSRLSLVLVVFVISLILVSGALAAVSRSANGQTPGPVPQGPGQLPEGGGPWVVRAYYDNPELVKELAKKIEPWEVRPDEGYLVVQVDQDMYLWMEWLGFRLEVDEKLTSKYNSPPTMLPGQVNGIPGFPCYRTVEETYTTAQDIVNAHPELASWNDIGDSWERVTPGGLPGYDIRVLRLTNSAIPGPKPKLFVMASIHAREYTTAELVTRYAELLVNNYNLDPDITWILDHNEIHLLLITNPDGRKHAETGELWRKNTDNNDGCNVSTDWGTDLNRNFQFYWGCCGGSSPSPCAETYRGPSAASEPETQAVQNYVIAEFPDQRAAPLTAPAPITATGVFLDIHSYSQLVLWPWGFTANPPPNDQGLKTLGRKFAYFNNYWPEQAIGLYPTDGTTDDFSYGELGLASYTFELGTDFFQDCGTFENTILPNNLPALIYSAKVARTPYMTPSGPDSLNVLAAPVAVAPGDPVQLTAIVNDTRFNNQNGTEPTQNIQTAKYTIDVPPWSTNPVPVAYPMAAADGAYNEKIEDVVATLDTSSLSTGRHIIYVRGQDVNDNWGPVSAAFLYILDPAVAPHIEGYVRDYATNAPIQATVTAAPFFATSSPITGFYNMSVVSGTYDLIASASGYASSTVYGIHAVDYQVAQQNFNLLIPNCRLFFDNIESGQGGWTPQSPWGITTSSSHSPSHSWTDSPGGNYSDNRNISLTSQVIDLSNATGTTLKFWHKYLTENGYDYGYVEYSENGGSTWATAAAYDGTQNSWVQETIPLPALDKEVDARIRFRFYSDQGIVADGWYIDDIELIGGDPSCVTPLAPTADFTSNNPVLPGETVRFTNLTLGSNPLSYAWDFGDSVGTSTESDPNYAYTTNGTYLVTLTVTNSLGSDSVTHPVVVEPCQPMTGMTLTLQTTGTLLLGQPLSFLVDIAPEDTTKPFDYSMDFGDGSPPQTGSSMDNPLTLGYTYTLPGEFLAAVTAQSCESPVFTDTLPVSIFAEEGIALFPLAASLEADPGATVTYTLRVTNTSPVSNSIKLALSGNAWTAQPSTATVGPLAPGQGGAFTVNVAIPGDALGGATDTATLTASSQFPGIFPVTATLTTSAAPVYGLELLVNETTKVGLPGALVTYTIQLTNTGNTQDTFIIDASGVWTSTVSVFPPAIPSSSVPLGSGASALIYVTVSIPSNTIFGEFAETQIAITSENDPMVTAQVTLTTTTNAHQVRLPLVLQQ